VLAAALTLVAGCGGTHHAAAHAPAHAAAQLHGLVPQPLPRKPSFTLTDTAGRPFSFATRTRGKLAYLYFGYTHCPDACPTTMADLAAALHRQSADVRRRVEVVFVTVDPRRDTERVLRAWLNHFNHAFVGLTGTQNQIAAVEREAGVPLAPPEKVTGKKYSVAHSSLVLPFSPDGRAHVVYTQGFHIADYAHDMPLLLVR
jgi:protein SCO1/2